MHSGYFSIFCVAALLSNSTDSVADDQRANLYPKLSYVWRHPDYRPPFTSDDERYNRFYERYNDRFSQRIIDRYKTHDPATWGNSPYRASPDYRNEYNPHTLYKGNAARNNTLIYRPSAGY